MAFQATTIVISCILFFCFSVNVLPGQLGFSDKFVLEPEFRRGIFTPNSIKSNPTYPKPGYPRVTVHPNSTRLFLTDFITKLGSILTTMALLFSICKNGTQTVLSLYPQHANNSSRRDGNEHICPFSSFRHKNFKGRIFLFLKFFCLSTKNPNSKNFEMKSQNQLSWA